MYILRFLKKLGLMRNNEIRIMQKLLLGYLFLILIPAITISIVYYNTINENLFERFQNDKKAVFYNVIDDLNIRISQIESIKDAFQSNYQIKEFLSGYYFSLEEEVYNNNKYISPFFEYWNSIAPISDKITIYNLEPSYSAFSKNILDVKKIPLSKEQIDILKKEGNGWINLSKSLDKSDYRYFSVIFSMDYYRIVGIIEIPFDINAALFEIQQKMEDNSFILYTHNEALRDGFIKSKTLVNRYYYEKLNADLVMVSSYNDNNKSKSTLIFMLFAIAFIFLFSGIYVYISYSITNRILGFAAHIKENADTENLKEYKPKVKINDELDMLINTFNNQISKINYLVNDVLKSKLREKRAEYKFLLSQINPHFIYNTLECIRMTAENYDNHETSEMIFVLGKYLRYNIFRNEYEIPLQSELGNLDDYLKLIKYRKENKFEYYKEVLCDIETIICPIFILQPIAENSIIHGFKNIIGVTEIRIKVSKYDKGYHILISDNGAGIEPDKLEEINNNFGEIETRVLNNEISGVGLINVNDRINSYYGKDYGLYIESVIGSGTTVHIRLGEKSENSELYGKNIDN